MSFSIQSLTAARTLLFVDPAVSNYDSLIAGAIPGTEVHLLDEAEDGIAQISQVLARRSDIASVQIVSHGDTAQLQLGQTELNAETLPAYAEQLRGWASALSAKANILLFGCNVAADAAGVAFVERLAELTGADIAASDDVTGQGGDWELEVQTGPITAAAAISAEVLQAYQGQLNLSPDTSITLPGLGTGSAAWGDYSGDGKLDLVLTGQDRNSNPTSKLYKNNGNGGLVEDTSISLPNVAIGSTTWGDYNGDGKLDLVLTGQDSNKDPIGKLYKNNGNGGLVEDTSITLPGLRRSSAAWGDYNGDGKLDLILTGNTGAARIAKLYKNDGNGGLVEDTSISLPGVDEGSAVWGDYSGDGKLDLILTGNTGFSRVTRLYKNDGSGGLAEDTSISLPGVVYSSAAWGDYSGDGKLDLILTGGTGFSRVTRLYKNNGNGGLVEDTSISLPNVASGSVAWNDYNSDGKLDLVLTGGSDAGLIAKLYKNNGNGGLVEDTSVSLPGMFDSSVVWGDYSGDGKADLILSGVGDAGPISILYRGPNQAPTLAFKNAVTKLPENTSTASRIKVADLAITDDYLGTNTITLSGADADKFEIDGNVLYLKANTSLDFEKQSSYAVAVNVDDATVGATPDASQTLTLTLTDVNEANPAEPTQPNNPSNPSSPATALNFGQPLSTIPLKGKMGKQQQGGDQDDVMLGSNQRDILNGKGGEDVISGRRGDDTILGGDGNDTLSGGEGRDQMDGGSGNDKLTGGRQRDQLVGGDGNDQLLAGRGRDICIGGAGKDRIDLGKDKQKDMVVFNDVNEGVDVIKSFGVRDVIDLRNIFAKPEFQASSKAEQFQRFIQLEQTNLGTAVKIDQDGNGAGTEFVTLAVLQNVQISQLDSTRFVV